MSSQNAINDLNHVRSIRAYHSCTLKELQTLFSFDLMALNNSRNTILVLTHINSYSQSIQTTFTQLYNITRTVVVRIISNLVDAGLIKPGKTKRRSNLGPYVPLIGYSITPAGKEVLKQLDDLVEFKLSIAKK